MTMIQTSLLNVNAKSSLAQKVRFAILMTAILSVACSADSGDARQVAPPKRPNILFIFCDDHAYQAISAYQSVSAYGLELNETRSPADETDVWIGPSGW